MPTTRSVDLREILTLNGGEQSKTVSDTLPRSSAHVYRGSKVRQAYFPKGTNVEGLKIYAEIEVKVYGKMGMSSED